MDSNIRKREEQLIEHQGAFYERYHNMSPIEARIFSLLLINGKRGTSFEQIVEKVAASKSTVSTNVKKLIEGDKILSFTERGDRKRYFIVNPVHFISSLNKELIRVQDELVINEEMISFKQEANLHIEKEEEKYQIVCQPSVYQDYLKESIELLSGFKQEIENRVKKSELLANSMNSDK